MIQEHYTSCIDPPSALGYVGYQHRASNNEQRTILSMCCFHGGSRSVG